MSIDSTYKNRLDVNLLPNKSLLHPNLAQREPDPRTRLSLKSPSKDRPRRERSKSRTRTASVSAESSTDTLTELISKINKPDNSHDRRSSELKPPVEHDNHTAVERRNSTPQLHLSALFSHPFRNQKHHQNKINTKDEPTPIHIASNQINNSANHNHVGDMITTKIDPTFSLKSPQTNDLRLKSSLSHERLLLNQNEDSILSSSSFIFEENLSEPRSAELFIIESHTPMCVSEIYREVFFDYFHINYYGEYDYEGPFIASLRCSYQKTSLGDVCEARAIIRTQYRNCDVTDIINGNNESNILQMLFNKINLPPVRAYGTVGDAKANEKIHLFDKTNDERYNSKIGVIYQRVNQTNEYDIFSNDYLSADMLDFLNILADRVRLKGFQKYRGDLDTKDDLHGEYSYYTVHENHEIMFNVAPLVPSTKANGQCIERKGLVGNAFVCIVFQEAGAIFSPDFISGKVTQIYITVQPLVHDDELYYKIGIWRRNDIKSVVDPPGGTYKFDRSFLSYFLTLLLNAVNVAIESPSLRTRVYEQRQRIKYEELKKLSYLFSLGPIPDFSPDTDNTHNQVDTRSNTRSESSVSNVTVTTNDSVNSNTGRISPVSTKKKGLSRKIFGVFSSRSGSISSTSTTPATQNSNDGTSVPPQTPSTSDANVSTTRQSVPSNKDAITRQRSLKNNQAPVLPARPSNSQTVSIQPPTPGVSIMNPLMTDSSTTQNNLINIAALSIMPRNRSNSSPEDMVKINKSYFYSVPKIDEEQLTTASSEEQDSDDESSDDEKPSNRPPFRYS